jgi:hypothetical protein
MENIHTTEVEGRHGSLGIDIGDNVGDEQLGPGKGQQGHTSL